MRLPSQSSLLPKKLEGPCRKIFECVREAGGQALLVGGCVRDALLGYPSQEIDIEVYGLDTDRLGKLLAAHFAINWVGKAFAVLKIRGLEIDISLPRHELKTGPGHRGFSIQSEPNLSFEEAAVRRDFTLNAISWDLLSGEIIDPCGGRRDLEAGLLRHTSKKFGEDPLRVLRAMQLVARFEFKVDPATVALCRAVGVEGLPIERILEEWKKLFIQGRKPSLGLRFLKDCDWIRYYPEIEALVGCAQDPQWHPEGDVWVHTLHCLDAFARERLGEAWEDLVVGLAVLCHDFGKPATTRFEDGHIRSPKHDVVGEKPTRDLLARITRHKDLVESVVPLVIAHLRPIELYKSQASDTAIRRLAHKVKRIDRLVRVARADAQGRPPKPGHHFPAGDWLLQRAEALIVKDSAPKPIVRGRHLIEMGHRPGPHFKVILDRCYQAQLNGAFADLEGGKAYATSLPQDPEKGERANL